MNGQLIVARVGVLRSDWNAEEFGEEVSFWSREDPQLFVVKGEPAQDGALESFYITVLKSEDAVAVSICDESGNCSLQTFSVSDDDEEQQFGGARAFIGKAISQITSGEVLSDDAAWLILSNGSEDMSDGDWADVVDATWYGEAGGGDQLILRDNLFAGGLYLDIVSHPDMEVEVHGNRIEFDPDQSSDNRDEASRFVGIGVA